MMKRTFTQSLGLALAFLPLFGLGCGKGDGSADQAAPKAAPKAPAPAPAPPKPADPIDTWKAAFEAIPQCPLADDGVAAKDYSTCLKPVWEALRPITSDPALRERLSKQLTLYLSDKNRTLVYYSVFQNQTYFDKSPSTLARLEQLMEDDHPGTADWAAIARFWATRQEPASQELAKNTLKQHKHPKVRVDACQFFDSSFKGNREVFDMLLGYAKNTAEPADLRSCAVTRLGDVGEEKDVKTIAGFLADTSVQYSALYALKLGIRTPASYKAYVDYFAANAGKPDKIEFGAANIFLPFDSDMDKLPKDKATKALASILMNKKQHQFTRGYAARDLGKLGAKAELEKAKAAYASATEYADKSVADAINSALAAIQ